MLYELCSECRNWFTDDSDKHYGVFTISDGTILPSNFIAEGQYFRIIGSLFHDGVYKCGEDVLKGSETFNGSVWAMRVPPPFIKLVADVEVWNEKYSSVASSPYTSESYGGYSYSKASESGTVSSWQKCFKDELKKWRKI